LRRLHALPRDSALQKQLGSFCNSATGVQLVVAQDGDLRQLEDRRANLALARSTVAPDDFITSWLIQQRETVATCIISAIELVAAHVSRPNDNELRLRRDVRPTFASLRSVPRCPQHARFGAGFSVRPR
jgi:hypothetical protein